MRWSDQFEDAHKIDNTTYDSCTNTVNVANKRATDMRANQRVKLAEPDVNDENEIKRDNLKVEILNTYDKYIKENCNHNGEIRLDDNNEVKNPVKVLNSIKERVVKQEIIVDETDKTNRIYVMKAETYLKSMKEHVVDDKEINKKELNKIERKLNGHSKSIVKIFKVGYTHGQQKRALRNATVQINGQVPVLRGAEKDHKSSEGNIKMRPIENAMDGPKKTISDIFSDIGAAIVEANSNDVVCSSTEEIIESFEKYKKRVRESK